MLLKVFWSQRDPLAGRLLADFGCPVVVGFLLVFSPLVPQFKHVQKMAMFDAIDQHVLIIVDVETLAFRGAGQYLIASLFRFRLS